MGPLQELEERDLGPEMNQQLDISISASKKMSLLVDNLITLSEIQLDKFIISNKPIDLLTSLENLASFVAMIAHTRQ